MHPFVSLMRTYCIDYTNSHDLSVCDSIMEPSYTVRICGMTLERDPAYKPSVETVFGRFAGLGLVDHDGRRGTRRRRRSRGRRLAGGG